MSRKRHSDRLREGFGPEYDREVQRVGRGKAESELEQRKKRVEQLNITPLSSQRAVGYQRDWDGAQSHFVDDHSGAISDADDLVGRVMQARGYPMGDFDQRIADISVDALHPDSANPRRIRDAELEALTRSLREYGFIQPVIARREDNTVIGGHQRLLAARRLGLKTVPVIFVDLRVEQARLLNLALNKISGDWDQELLARLLADLQTVPDLDSPFPGSLRTK